MKLNILEHDCKSTELCGLVWKQKCHISVIIFSMCVCTNTAHFLCMSVDDFSGIFQGLNA